MTDGRFDSGKIVQGTEPPSASHSVLTGCFVPVTAAPGHAFRWGSPLVGQGGGQGKGEFPLVGEGKSRENRVKRRVVGLCLGMVRKC